MHPRSIIFIGGPLDGRHFTKPDNPPNFVIDAETTYTYRMVQTKPAGQLEFYAADNLNDTLALQLALDHYGGNAEAYAVDEFPAQSVPMDTPLEQAPIAGAQEENQGEIPRKVPRDPPLNADTGQLAGRDDPATDPPAKSLPTDNLGGGGVAASVAQGNAAVEGADAETGDEEGDPAQPADGGVPPETVNPAQPAQPDNHDDGHGHDGGEPQPAQMSSEEIAKRDKDRLAKEKPKAAF